MAVMTLPGIDFAAELHFVFASLVALVDISGFFSWQDAVIAKTDAELTWRLRDACVWRWGGGVGACVVGS